MTGTVDIEDQATRWIVTNLAQDVDEVRSIVKYYEREVQKRREPVQVQVYRSWGRWHAKAPKDYYSQEASAVRLKTAVSRVLDKANERRVRLEYVT